MRFTEGLIKNKYVVWALVIAAVIFGIQAYFSIPMQLFPDTAPPLINVITAYPGAGAKDVNETLSQKLEEEFASLDGVVKTKATSQDNLSIISVEFDYERDVDLAAVDIQNSISRIKNTLPAGITDPQVLKFSTSDKPVVTIGIISDDLTKARKMSEDVFAPTLQRIQGVAAVDVFGGNKPALIIELNRRDVEAYRIPFQKVVNAVREFNYSMPAGQIRTETTQTMFRLESRAENIEDIRNIPISLPNGNRLLLGEISSIKKGSLDDDARFSIDGRNAIAIQIFKTYDANTVEVVKKSLEKAKELDSQYSSYSFITGEESATFTEISVSNLLSNVWQALLFASIIIFLFLGRIRSSLVTIVSMPLSFGLTFVLMKLFNVEFNMVTLSAIILAVGMVVDSSIVILENITRRMMEEGESPEKAVVNGTSEVGLAVLAGVATTLSVLIPLLFLEEGVHDVEVLHPLARPLQLGGVGSEFLQGGDEPCRVPCQFHGRGVGQVFPLAAHRELDERRQKGGDNGQDDGNDGEDCLGLPAAPGIAAPPSAAEGTVEQAPPDHVGQEDNGPHHHRH
ncbi:MAG TPA: efflux RND transporter permease subunit, partial [bacterium]|nr:efflux RND transporter permease subunit [bacterium]